MGTFEGTKSLETPGLNRMLNRHLANALVESIKEVKHHFESNKMWNLEQVFSSTTVREFDNRFTAKMFGYKDVMEYYADARLCDKVENIKVPTMAINAEDDPFQPSDSIPKAQAERSSHLGIVTTKYGGHVGFVEGWIPSGQTGWLLTSFKQFLAIKTCWRGSMATVVGLFGRKQNFLKFIILLILFSSITHVCNFHTSEINV